jgi:DNA-binding CsgD family transcriptional regulator
MDHLILGLRTVALMVAVLGAVQVIQAQRVYPLPFLRTWSWFTLCLALDLLAPVVFGYFKLNMAAPGFQSPLGVLVLADIGIHLSATVGYTGLLLETSRRIVDRHIPWIGWFLFAVCVVVSAFLQGAGLAGGEEVNLFLAQIGTSIVASLAAVLALLVLLQETRRLLPGPVRRATTAFGLSYLPGFVVLLLIVLLLPHNRVLLHALSLLYLAGVPLFWLPFFFRSAWGGGGLLAGNGAVLDRLAGEHDLTRREREILEGLLQGKSGKELADELFISLSTVKNHTYNLYRKLGVDSRHRLYRLVLDQESPRNGRTA